MYLLPYMDHAINCLSKTHPLCFVTFFSTSFVCLFNFYYVFCPFAVLFYFLAFSPAIVPVSSQGHRKFIYQQVFIGK